MTCGRRTTREDDAAKVDMDAFTSTIDQLFENEDGETIEVPFNEFMKHCLEMRKTNTARVFDVVQVNKLLSKEMIFVKESLNKLQKTFDNQSPCTGAGLKNISSTNIIDILYSYFGLVRGCIDVDLCK